MFLKFLRMILPTTPSSHRKRPASSRRSRSPARPAVELLEDRLVPATLSISPTGVLTYTASAGIANNLRVTLSSGPGLDTYTFQDTAEPIALGAGTSAWTVNGPNSVSGLQSTFLTGQIFLWDKADTVSLQTHNPFLVDTGSDDDSVTAELVTAPLTVNAGDGNNTVNIGNAAHTMDSIISTVTVNGQGGNAQVVLHDEGESNPIAYGLVGNAVTRTGPGGVICNQVAGVQINGGSAFDTLIGDSALNNLWQITGPNAGLVGKVRFTGIENLTGGVKDDTFVFRNGSKVSGNINGGYGSGRDTLDYSALTTSVHVDLSTSNTATGVDGHAVSIHNVLGGSADDVLIGDASDNILVGNGGNDVLVGNAGRDILIGGGGSDFLDGRDGDDLLIGGSTVYDTNLTALESIRREWSRTDLLGTAQQQYDQRILHLEGLLPGGLNTVYLTLGTVLDDGAADDLTGGLGLDWFWTGAGDTIADQNLGGLEKVN
jgi:Ca2+-binding RTX toxin-like protein